MYKTDNKQIQQQLVEYLESFLTEERKLRLNEIVNNRTKYATVIVEDLYQTQNISAVLRSCECVGIQEVHVIENENEFNIHKAIAMGADKWLDVQHYPKSDHNIEDCIVGLQQKGYRVAATLPADDSVLLNDFPTDKPTAFLFGTELTGLSKRAIELADCTVKIPMYGFTTSFNISNSVAIIVCFFIEKMRKNCENWPLSAEEKADLYFEWVQKSVKTPELLIKNFLSKNNCLY